MILLEAHALTITNGNKPVCINQDFRLQAGEIWGVLGPNGIGKTSLLHTLAGLRKPLSGQVTLREKPLASYDRKHLATYLGIVFQDSQDTFPATVLETVLMGRHPYLSEWAWESVEDIRLCMAALEQVALATLAQRQVNTLSGGERRRLALAILLAQNPSVCLLDEPTNHLDLHHQMVLLELIVQKTLQRNGGVVMVLQDVNLVPRFCTHALLMHNADSWISGSVVDVMTTTNLQLLYQHSIRKLVDNGVMLFYPE